MEHHPHPQDSKQPRRELSMAKMEQVKDPVCGMMVDPLTAAGKFEHAGIMYYFCNLRCLDRFSHDPENYLTENIRSRWKQPPKPGATYIFSLSGRK